MSISLTDKEKRLASMLGWRVYKHEGEMFSEMLTKDDSWRQYANGATALEVRVWRRLVRMF
jgi:hypothetical protein